MPDFLGRAATGERVIRDHFGRERLLARELRFGGSRAQAHDGRGLRIATQCVARAGDDAFEPRVGQRVVVDVAVDAVDESPGAERGESFVDLPAGLAELRITRVPEREHRIRQLLELRRAARLQELDEATRVVRRVAVALRADDQHEHAFPGQVLDQIGGMPFPKGNGD